MTSGARGIPVFENTVTIGGRLVAAPERVNNPTDDQIRFTLAYPYRQDRAYYIEVNVFGELARVARDGDRHSQRLGKGDTVLIQGRLNSYAKKVTGARGTFRVTRVTVVADTIERRKAGRAERVIETEQPEEE